MVTIWVGLVEKELFHSRESILLWLFLLENQCMLVSEIVNRVSPQSRRGIQLNLGFLSIITILLKVLN